MTTTVEIINRPLTVVVQPNVGPDVTIEVPPVIEATMKTVGLQGPPGADGVGASPAFTFTQAVAAMIWTIDHNLGYRPIIAVTDDAGDEIEATVNHPTTARTTVVFSEAVSGIARLF